MIVLWIIVLVAGVTVAAAASRRAVGAALDASEELGISAGIIGVSVMAIGTDLPEIANSIMAALSGHGDLSVGDATGSALTQVTLILAILLLAAGMTTSIAPEQVRAAAGAGVLSVIGLVLLAALIQDGEFGRLEGLVLVLVWIISMLVLGRKERPTPREDRVAGELARPVVRTIGWLALVGASASLVVRSFIEVTESLGAPVFLTSTIVLAFGTSLPELVVDWTAIRRGATALAIGDLFGSTLVDSTLAVGIGPMLRAVSVSPEATTGALVIAVGVATTTALVAAIRSPRRLAVGVLAVYGVSMTALVALAA